MPPAEPVGSALQVPVLASTDWKVIWLGSGAGRYPEDELDARVDVERPRGARRVHIGVQPAEPVGAVAVPQVPEGQASGVTLVVSLAERLLRVTPSATSQPKRAPAIGAAGSQSKNTTQAAWSF